MEFMQLGFYQFLHNLMHIHIHHRIAALVRIGVSDNGGSFRCCVTRDLLFVFIDHLLVLLIFLQMLLSMFMKYDRYRYT